MWILWTILGILAVLLLTVALRTALCRPEKAQPIPKRNYELDADTLALHLSGAVQIKTIATESMDTTDPAPFEAFHAYLRETFPRIHETMSVERVNHSLLYHWKGTTDARPIVLMAHMDVVPVEEATLDKWTHTPFGGEIADGYVHGRGSIDMKGHLIAKLEAVEYLLKQGFTPERDVYLALGHDEEQMGLNGGKLLAEKLRAVNPEYVFDEGGAIINGKEFGIDGKIAAIGIAEKSTMNVRLTAHSKGGHASMPPRQTAVGALAEAIDRLEKTGFPMYVNQAAGEMFDTLKPHMNTVFRMALCNLWLFKPIFFKIMRGLPKGAALLHTTATPTMLSGSMQPNVLAQQATATLNCRIIPGETMQSALDRIQKLVGPDIEVTVLYGSDPAGVSSTHTLGFAAMRHAVHAAIDPDIVVAPYLMMATSDSRHYDGVAEAVYRFDPFQSVGEDLDTIHGVNERLSIQSLKEGTAFFINLLEEIC